MTDNIIMQVSHACAGVSPHFLNSQKREVPHMSAFCLPRPARSVHQQIRKTGTPFSIISHAIRVIRPSVIKFFKDISAFPISVFL
jgi:hypothetical protein